MSSIDSQNIMNALLVKLLKEHDGPMELSFAEYEQVTEEDTGVLMMCSQEGIISFSLERPEVIQNMIEGIRSEKH